MFQPGVAQATAFQQASELVAEAVGEPSLRVDPADADPAGTLVERLRQLPPAKRKAAEAALAALYVVLLQEANLVLHSRAVTVAVHLAYVALAIYGVWLALEEE